MPRQTNFNDLALRVADHINAILAYWDKDQVCRFASNAYKEWYEKKPGEMVDKITLKELLGPLYEYNLPYIKGALNGIHQEFEREIKIPSREVRYSLANYFPDCIDGEVRGFFVHEADISVHKKAENELKASELKFKGLLESAPDAIVIVNGKGRIELVNSQTENIFGYNRSEIVGKELNILIPDRFKSNHPQNIERFFSDAQSRPMGGDIELYGRNKNGKEFPVEISLSPLQTESEALVSASIRNLTGRKASEDKLRQFAVLEAKNKEMEQLAYITSHDLREPILSMKRYSEMLLEDYHDILDERGLRCTHSILKGLQRMEAQINSLLDYSRLSKPKQLVETDCNVVVNDVLADLDSIITITHATLTIEKLPVIKAYPLELKLLFQNLINNAIKFRKKNSIPEIHISSKKINTGWQFEVKDNGIGIEEKDLEKIFIIFQRLNNKDEYEGTGIGLAHCKKITELHNGTIWVKSIPGVSSSFYFTILT